MRVPFDEPTHLFIDGPVAVYLRTADPSEIREAIDRLRALVHHAAGMMSHVRNPSDSHVGPAKSAD